VTGSVRVSKVARGWEASEAYARCSEEVVETVTYRGNREKEVRKGNGSGAEGAREFSASVVLSDLENGKEGGLGNVGEPDLGRIGEDGKADGMKNLAPGDELQASDRITEDTESPN